MTKLAPLLPMLRSFEAVARIGSLSGAARELGVTPSAVSQQMQLLEGRLGVVLFERHARGLTVTGDGRQFGCDVRAALDDLDGAVARVVGGEARGPLRISTVGSFAQHWLMPRLARFRVVYPAVVVRLDAEQRAVDLSAREADLAIRFGAGDYPGLWTQLLMLDQVFPVCAPSLIDEALPVAVGDLVGRLPLIHDDGIGPHEPRLGWPRWLRDAGASAADGQDLHFGDSVLALAAARVGEGVLLARRSIAQRMIDAGELVRPVAECRATDGAYYLVAPRGGPTGAAAAFATWIAGEAEHFIAECADQDARNAAISSGNSDGSGKRS